MSSFGKWYEDSKRGEDGGASTWSFPSSEDVLPLFSLNTESMQAISWDSMKSSMESQMPQKVMGMGYQQRFKVPYALHFLFMFCHYFVPPLNEMIIRIFQRFSVPCYFSLLSFSCLPSLSGSPQLQ